MPKKTEIGCSFSGFPVLLTVLFIGLKLGGVITWSWVWVLAPMWISVSIGVVIFFLAAVLIAIAQP